MGQLTPQRDASPASGDGHGPNHPVTQRLPSRIGNHLVSLASPAGTRRTGVQCLSAAQFGRRSAAALPLPNVSIPMACSSLERNQFADSARLVLSASVAGCRSSGSERVAIPAKFSPSRLW